MKEYHICASIDFCEGLAQDYTVLNIFGMLRKPKQTVERTHDTLANVYEYSYIEQIRMFRANNWSIEEFSELESYRTNC